MKNLKELATILLTKIEKSLGANPPKVTVLLYHSISEDDTLIDVKNKNFKHQLSYLRKNFEFITLDQVMDYISGRFSPKKPAVALTFYDGYEDIVENVIPVLEKYSIPATFFIVAEPDNVKREELKNGKKILALENCSFIKNGLFAVGSHTLTHTDLKASSIKTALIEMKKSKTILENSMGKINYFAYPKGFYTKEVAQAAKGIYKASFTTDPGLISRNTNLSLVNRIGVDRTITNEMFPSLFTYWILGYFAIKPYFIPQIVKLMDLLKTPLPKLSLIK